MLTSVELLTAGSSGLSVSVTVEFLWPEATLNDAEAGW
jgi:hypothetical protein